MDRATEIREALDAALDDIDGDRSPLDLVGEIPILTAAIAQIVADRVAEARAQGLSWEAIAQRLGITRQAAQKRFGKTKRTDRNKSNIDVRLQIRRRSSL